MMKRILATVLCGILVLGSMAGCGNKPQETSTQPNQQTGTPPGNQSGDGKLDQLQLTEASQGAYIKNNGKYFLGTAEDMRTRMNEKMDADMGKIGKLVLDGDKYWYNKDSSYDAVTAAFALDDAKEHIQVINYAFPYPASSEDKSSKIRVTMSEFVGDSIRLLNGDNQPLVRKVFDTLLCNSDGDVVFERGKAKSIIAQGLYYCLKIDSNTNVMVLTITPTERADESWVEDAN